MNRNIIKTVLERFSCSLIGRGKKIAGHRILLRSLFILREKNEKTLLSLLKKKDQFEKIKMRSLLLLKNLKKIKSKSAFLSPEATCFASPEVTPIKDFNLQDKTLLSSNFKGLQNEVLSKQIFTRKKGTFPLLNSTIDFTKAIIKPSRKEDGSLRARENAQRLLQNHFKQKNFVKYFFSTRTSILNQKTETQNKEMYWMLRNQLKNSKICQLCVDKAKPILETRKIRKGRITHRIPIVTNRIRQQGKSITSLIQNAVSRKKTSSIFLDSETDLDKKKLLINSSWFSSVSKIANPLIKQGFVIPSSCAAKNSIKYNLAEEFFDAGNGKGQSVEKKKQLHIFALQNRASLHFRWW